MITPSTHEGWARFCQALTGRGVNTTAVLVEAATFGQAPSTLLLVSSLAAAHFPTYLIKRGDRLDAQDRGEQAAEDGRQAGPLDQVADEQTADGQGGHGFQIRDPGCITDRQRRRQDQQTRRQQHHQVEASEAGVSRSRESLFHGR